jgi:hypothetical protein
VFVVLAEALQLLVGVQDQRIQHLVVLVECRWLGVKAIVVQHDVAETTVVKAVVERKAVVAAVGVDSVAAVEVSVDAAAVAGDVVGDVVAVAVSAAVVAAAAAVAAAAVAAAVVAAAAAVAAAAVAAVVVAAVAAAVVAAVAAVALGYNYYLYA